MQVSTLLAGGQFFLLFLALYLDIWFDLRIFFLNVRIISIVQYVIRTFVLHVSIAKPLGESGKLQLTSDMTELEFALGAFMVDSTQGHRRSGGDWTAIAGDYRALRAMRFVYS
jgi:hypothetical protein